MPSRREIIRRLSTLGEREREVLTLVCRGMAYREISVALVIELGTVKSTMAHVYVKLGLDQLQPSARRKILFQECCPALAFEEIPPQSEEDRRLVVVPSEKVKRMVDEDEKAIVAQGTTALMATQQQGNQGGSFWRFLSRALVIVGLVALGIIVGGLILYFILTGPLGVDLATQAAEIPDTSAVDEDTPEQSEEPVIDDNPATVPTPTVQPSDTPLPAPTDTPLPTDIPLPTSTPRPTHTPIPLPTDTPLGMVDEVFSVSGEESDTETGDGLKADPDTWYSTGVYVQQGDLLVVQYLGGEWWIGKQQGNQFISQTPTDAGGYTGREEERVVAEMQVPNPDKCYTLRSAPIGSLIGKIGEDGPVFFIGNDYEQAANLTGILHLRINYNSRMGYAFHSDDDCPVENGGEISVRVQVIP